jgi:hypothetical protein
MRTRFLGLAAASTSLSLMALLLAGCGEKPAVTVYKQGQYQGKPDNQPWESQPFNNNKADWEKSIRARNNGQNEYLRTGTQ